ncbi:TPA: hypothetical protein PPG74_RS24905, partial [Escherichia coli]
MSLYVNTAAEAIRALSL